MKQIQKGSLSYRFRTLQKDVLDLFSSLKLTIVSLTGLFIVVLWSTLAQVDLGIFEAKKHFYEGFFIYKQFKNFSIPIFLTGYTWGILLVLNLIVSHFKRFRLTTSKIGIWLIHSGLIMLLIGSGIISSYAIESQLAIEEGETAWYSQSTRDFELVFYMKEGATIKEVVVPTEYYKKSMVITHEELPVRVFISSQYENADIGIIQSEEEYLTEHRSDYAGFGQRLKLRPLPKSFRDDIPNSPAVVLQLGRMAEDNQLDTFAAFSLKWLVSASIDVIQWIPVNKSVLGERYFSDETNSETLNIGVQLRPKRFYNAYSLTLHDFSHDLYEGTKIPKNFSSQVSIVNQETQESFKELIYMNHPLRYEGKTYYQASYGKNDTLSVLQVVENPGRSLPYISSLLICVGLLVHFGVMMWQRRVKT